MAKFGKTEWAGVLLGFGGGAMLTLIAAPDLPFKTALSIIGIAGLSFSGAAYCFNLYRAPFLIGVPIRTVLILALIWSPLLWLAYAKLPKPNFPYIKSGPLLNPQSPNAVWGMMIVDRGHDELSNVNVSFADQGRSNLLNKKLNQGNLTPQQATDLVTSTHLELHYPELNPNTVGGIDSEDGIFYWRPGEALPDESYEIVIGHAKGSIREHLYIKQIGDEWREAMYLNDERTEVTLIKCRDTGFPADGEWWSDAPRCFPKFESRSLTIGEQLSLH
jgi:hypothetical protein